MLESAEKSQRPARRGAAQRGGRGGKSIGRAAGPMGRGPGRFGEATGIEGDAWHVKEHELRRLPAAPPSLPIPCPSVTPLITFVVGTELFLAN